MKKWWKFVLWSLLVLLLLAALFAGLRWRHAQNIGGRLGDIVIVKPVGLATGASPHALVALYAGDLHEGSLDWQAAHELARRGALVAVVDLRAYMNSRRDVIDGHCDQLASEIQYMSKKLMRREGILDFMQPVVVGLGAGGQLARLAVSSAPSDTLAGAVQFPATDARPVTLPRCDVHAPDTTQGYLVQVTPAPDSEDSVRRLADQVMSHAPKAQSSAAHLPLVPLPRAGSDRMVVFLSGDGGWRDFDEQLAKQLNNQGVAVLGWDSLRYFWSTKTPQEGAADLARAIERYQAEWHVKDVALVGFSFGADVMPFLYNALPEAQRRNVSLMALAGLAHKADFSIRVGGWMGFGSKKGSPILPEVQRIPPTLIQCMYGEDEKGTLCPELAGTGVDLVKTAGGHHLDGNSEALAARILRRWDEVASPSRRLADRPVADGKI